MTARYPEGHQRVIEVMHKALNDAINDGAATKAARSLLRLEQNIRKGMSIQPVASRALYKSPRSIQIGAITHDYL